MTIGNLCFEETWDIYGMATFALKMIQWTNDYLNFNVNWYRHHKLEMLIICVYE